MINRIYRIKKGEGFGRAGCFGFGFGTFHARRGLRIVAEIVHFAAALGIKRREAHCKKASFSRVRDATIQPLIFEKFIRFEISKTLLDCANIRRFISIFYLP